MTQIFNGTEEVDNSKRKIPRFQDCLSTLSTKHDCGSISHTFLA